MMTSLPIQLPDDLLEFIDQQIQAGRYQSLSDFVAQVIDGERRRLLQSPSALALSELEMQLEAAINSGEPTSIDEDYFDRLLADLRADFGPDA